MAATRASVHQLVGVTYLRVQRDHVLRVLEKYTVEFIDLMMSSFLIAWYRKIDFSFVDLCSLGRTG